MAFKYVKYVLNTVQQAWNIRQEPLHKGVWDMILYKISTLSHIAIIKLHKSHDNARGSGFLSSY